MENLINTEGADELTVLLVEDDTEACKRFAEYADTLEDVHIVSITNNSSKALADIRDYLPGAVILDLELHHGSGNGLEVLKGIRDMNPDVYPYILITTNNSSSVTYEYAREMGADFIMSKHQADYSEKNALEFLRMMKTVIKSKAKALSSGGMTTESPVQHSKRVTRRIMAELNHVGISPKAVGYQYLADAILMLMDKPVQNVSKS